MFTKKQYIFYFSSFLALSLIFWLVGCNLYPSGCLILFFDSLVSHILFSFLGIGLWYFTKYNISTKSTIIQQITMHFSGAIAMVGFWIFLMFLFYKISFVNINIAFNSLIKLEFRVFLGLAYYVILNMIFRIIFYYKKIHNKEKQEITLKAMLKESEIQALKSQINPHFLFNSLNSIYALIQTNSQNAGEMVLLLSEYLRNVLLNSEKQFYTVKEELENLKKYIAIEQIRFSNKLKININSNQDCSNQKIPVMLLQPIIENAIKYHDTDSNNPIELSIYQSNEQLIINTKNSYNPEFVSIKKSTGKGLQNLKNRLAWLYNKANILNITNSNAIFEVKIRIPKNQQTYAKTQ